MVITPEIEPQHQQPKPESQAAQAEPPKESQPTEEHGASHAPSQVAAQIAQTVGTQVTPQTDDQQVVTVTVPATPQQLQDWSKGSPDNSLTWLAFYWIRMVKKALLHGYRIISQGSEQQYA